MTLDYWWSKRNNRRDVKLPDLDAPYVDCDLPGTPESRLEACLTLAYRHLVLAHKRAGYKKMMKDDLHI